MEIGVLYLSHATLVLAELIVCSARGFACILAKWFWPTVMSLSLTYGSPEASCNKRADTYLGPGGHSILAHIRDVPPEWVSFPGRKLADGCKFLTKTCGWVIILI